MPSDFEIDKIDLGIVAELSKDAKIPYTDLAEKLHISAGTVHVRMRRLKAFGVVKGSRLIIDPAKLGYDLCAFIGIYLDKGSDYKHVIKALKKITEVTEAHFTTGQYGIFAKLYCKNTEHIRTVINEKIQAITGIQRTETFISLEESINRQILTDS